MWIKYMPVMNQEATKSKKKQQQKKQGNWPDHVLNSGSFKKRKNKGPLTANLLNIALIIYNPDSNFKEWVSLCVKFCHFLVGF